MFTNLSMRSSAVSNQSERRVDVRQFKLAVAMLLPDDHPLARLMIVEDDRLEAREFLAKMRTWLRLLRTN
jgi:hypothetical protein